MFDDAYETSSTEAYKRWEEFRNAELRKIIVQLEQENIELKNEIRKLRNDLESKCDYADQIEAKAKRTVSENTKLRELCLDAYEWMGRALYDSSARRSEYESITECMRKLGIEASA